MPGKLAAELQQKGFASIEQETVLSILRTAQLLDLKNTEVLKPYGLTLAQYNVLRILRGAGSAGLASSQIAERMITHAPDVTRLLDRMEALGWVLRERSCTDRRIIIATITKEALGLLKQLDAPLTEAMSRTFSRLGRKRMRNLIDTLEQVRANIF